MTRALSTLSATIRLGDVAPFIPKAKLVCQGGEVDPGDLVAFAGLILPDLLSGLNSAPCPSKFFLHGYPSGKEASIIDFIGIFR